MSKVSSVDVGFPTHQRDQHLNHLLVYKVLSY